MNPSLLPVLPAEHSRQADPVTGAELTFCTARTHESRALYFHQRAWLADESLLLFYSWRPEPTLMGYLPATGELVELGADRWGTVAAREGRRLFTVHGRAVLEVTLEIDPGPPSRVTAGERVICRLPEGTIMAAQLQENADGTLLGWGLRWPAEGRNGIVTADIRTGELREVGRIDFASSHVLFSRTSPYLMSFNTRQHRLNLVDCRVGEPWCLYQEAAGEYATHENWWVDDQLLFLGGRIDVEGFVKVIDARTGVVRIIGQSAWEPYPPAGGGPEMNRWYWWEAAGSEDGRWVVTDNWYGDVVVIDARTARLHRLTLNHRPYRGAHQEQPTAAWDRTGRRVAFTSQMLGGVQLCLAARPEQWWEDPVEQVPRLPGK